ncbi:alpha/beta-hydrolase [Anaeromyces robustus]|uniref:Alpha/beta-hydrolase n=1 Tax=Anaeromyces robustus TaxID=1754192 RepID=A0A1Y1XCG7_9FUNG|nr:alpha/beta-hydrolase [Anaeromyces robustus]|eukprot:ORX83428.1 alpha/beta-hydrolase [Anaeromyces robustus]
MGKNTKKAKDIKEKNTTTNSINNSNKEIKQKKEMGKKKITQQKKISKLFKIISSLILLLIYIYINWNIYCSIVEHRTFKTFDYGKKLTVNNHKMVVDIQGENNEPTIIFLTGLGSPSPILHYKPLIETLSKDYRVITMEPFGYGLSDKVDEERTLHNVVNELHKGIEQIEFNNYKSNNNNNNNKRKYYLMAHSFGGIYSLYWSNQYPDEVLGFVGLDITVPKIKDKLVHLSKGISITNILNVIGFQRIKSIFNKRNVFLQLYNKYPYTEKEIEMFRIMSLVNSYNKSIRNEANLAIKNLESIYEMKFPSHIPVINFICDYSKNKGFKSPRIPDWKEKHLELGKNSSVLNEIVELSGDHKDAPLEHKELIAKKIKNIVV